MSAVGLIGGLALLAAAGTDPAVQARDDLKLPREGWVSWQLPASAGARDWCCFEGVQPGLCQLDGPPQGYGSRDHTQMQALRVYARFAGGALEQLRAYGSTCPVSAKTAIADLGTPAPGASLRWLARQIEPRSVHSDDALAAVSVHADAAALELLSRSARSSASVENRSQALFWLSQRAAPESERIIGDVLRADRNAQVRQRAVFALSQLPAPRAFQALTAVLEDHQLRLEDRKRALFWLGQSEDVRAQAYLAKVLGG